MELVGEVKKLLRWPPYPPREVHFCQNFCKQAKKLDFFLSTILIDCLVLAFLVSSSVTRRIWRVFMEIFKGVVRPPARMFTLARINFLRQKYGLFMNATFLLSMIFSGPTMCADVCSNLSTGHITYLGPPRFLQGPKLAFSQLKANVTTYLIKQCLNQAGTGLRTSRLPSLAHLPDPEYPN